LRGVTARQSAQRPRPVARRQGLHVALARDQALLLHHALPAAGSSRTGPRTLAACSVAIADFSRARGRAAETTRPGHGLFVERGGDHDVLQDERGGSSPLSQRFPRKAQPLGALLNAPDVAGTSGKKFHVRNPVRPAVGVSPRRRGLMPWRGKPLLLDVNRLRPTLQGRNSVNFWVSRPRLKELLLNENPHMRFRPCVCGPARSTVERVCKVVYLVCSISVFFPGQLREWFDS